MIRSCCARRHSGVRRSEGVGGTGFYFNEDQGCFASITANQIDFAASFRSEISVKDPETVATKVIGGHFFTVAAERQVAEGEVVGQPLLGQNLLKNENTSEKPARMSADESHKVHESVSFQGAPAFHSLCFDQNRIAGIRYAIFSSYDPA